MSRIAALAVVALAVVIALYSGSVLLILAAVCGAAGIATLANAIPAAPVRAAAAVPVVHMHRVARPHARRKSLLHN